MYDPKILDALRKEFSRWQQTTLADALARTPERQKEFTTASSEPVERLYTPLDLSDFDDRADLGLPGEYPFTRGIHATGHRGRLWTMRLFAGFGSAEESNVRYKYLLDQGSGGLSMAFDLPTLMGYDTDAPEAAGEFGTCGVAVSSLKDMELLLDGIPLGKISSSMTINSPAAVLWAMYIAVAEQQGVPPGQLRGTIQYDILEAGSTAAQELAFTLADGMEYVRWGIARGMEVDEFAPRLSFFFNAHNDFFEEVSK